ncbi:hypothetical protein OUZ56_012092 [Daphnia magna]|uniref:Uncharacterized protein n=1 Tax=Daphnia magna TaxID=35525 RepID=A0ABQ9Z235_9CRUS|nr:hypothetical protein OUZ56_012092 [Daphnia magna]
MKRTSKDCSTENENSLTIDREDIEAANNLDSPIPSQLEQYLNQIQSDFNIDADGSVPLGEEVKKHERRMGQIAVDWDVHWDEVVNGLIASYATIPSLCWICKSPLQLVTLAVSVVSRHIVKTATSNSIHGIRQLLFQDSKVIKLKPNEFWDSTLAEIVTKEVAVPCFVPLQCQSCLSINSLTIEPLKSKFMIVVTLLGNQIFKTKTGSLERSLPSG